jgi:hypothetical protein
MEKSLETIQIPNGKLALVAKYDNQVIKEYQGNPLIEALPPINSLNEAMERLAVYPEIHPDEKDLDMEYRFHCIQRMFNYTQPVEKHLELEQRFSRIIRRGYIARNPVEKTNIYRLQAGNKAIKNKVGISDYYKDIRTTAMGFTIIGISGVGKSTAIERVLSLYPQVIVHTKYRKQMLSFYQLTFLKLDCPYSGSLKGLCIDFFLKVDSILGTNYHYKFGKTKNSVDMMLSYMVQVSAIHGLGVLIIDEIQHLNLSKSGGSDKMLNFFVTLVNTIGVPVILIGTTKALSILQSEFRQARRGAGQGDMIWDRMKNDDSWDLIIEGLWTYQWTKNKNPLTKEIKETLYEESQGIIDIAVKLYMLAQLEAITNKGKNGLEIISPETIKKVSKKHLKLVKPMIEALKSEDIREIAKFEDIRPVDIQEAINEQEQLLLKRKEILLHQKVLKEKEKMNSNRVVVEIVKNLLNLKIQPNLAEKFAKEAIEELGVEEAEEKLIQHAALLALKSTNEINKSKSQPKKKKNDTEDSMLRLLDIAKKEKKSVYEVFQSANIIKPIVELFS